MRSMDVCESEEDCGASDDEQSRLVPLKDLGKLATASRSQARYAAVATVAFLCVAAVAALAVVGPPSGPQAGPITVRALLESPELADLATDNVLAVGGASLAPSDGRAEVRAAVARQLANISDTIRRRLPEDHERLGAITLSEAQRRSVMARLRKFSDPRMAAISGAVADAVRETAAASGDDAALKRRLQEKLLPHLGDLQQLRQELFPAKPGDVITLNLDDTPAMLGFSKWHSQLQVTAPEVGGASGARRRLAAADDLSGGVHAQVAVMFDQLGEMVGDEMPAAPARMLTGSQQESFMSCMMEQMAKMNPAGAVGCVMSNMQTVFKIISQMLMGGMR